MQRRAAAIYATLFILIAAGSYVTIGVAQEPTISLQNPDFSLSENDTFTVDGRTYTVTDIGDGEATLVWVNQSARFSETLAADATVTVDGTDFSVSIDANATPPQVTLTEVRTVPENVTVVEDDNETFVVQERDGQRVLVPRDRYLDERFGPADTRRLTPGDRFEFQNNTVTVDSITPDEVVLTWTGERRNDVPARAGENVTLNGRQFVAHFPDDATLVFESDFQAFARDERAIAKFEDRMQGLWIGTIMSSLAAVLILGLSYLPSRY